MIEKIKFDIFFFSLPLFWQAGEHETVVQVGPLRPVEEQSQVFAKTQVPPFWHGDVQIAKNIKIEKRTK